MEHQQEFETVFWDLFLTTMNITINNTVQINYKLYCTQQNFIPQTIPDCAWQMSDTGFPFRRVCKIAKIDYYSVRYFFPSFCLSVRVCFRPPVCLSVCLGNETRFSL